MDEKGSAHPASTKTYIKQRQSIKVNRGAMNGVAQGI